MILGYEQPVDIPMMSMYDKDMMKMYLGAVLKDYEQGLADLKEFLNNYNNFVSIMPGASEAYYNAGMKGVNDTYDRLVQQGIDPIRSVQGREAMARARMSANTRLMSNIKSDSAAYELYQKAAATLAALGKYDKALSDWWLKQNGIDPDNWDFNGNKRWDIMSPLLSATIQQLLAPTIEELAKNAYERDPNLSKDGRRVDVVKRSSIDAALNRGIDDLLKDPRMQYFYLTSGLSKEDFLNQLGGRAEGILRPKVSEDKYWFDTQKLNIDREKLGIDKYNAQTGRMNAQTSRMNANNSYMQMMLSAGYTLDENNKLVKPTTPTTPPTHHQKTDVASISKRAEHLGGGSNGGNASNFDKRMSEIVNYWTGLKNNINYSKDAKFKARVDRQINWASRVRKEGIGKAIKNGMFTRNANGDLVPTSGFERVYSTIETDGARLQTPYDTNINQAISRRNTFTTSPTDRVTRLSVAERFAGTSSIAKDIKPGDGIKNRVVQLGSEDIVFTPHRAMTSSGKAGNTSSGIAKKFDDFIHARQIEGYFTDNSYSGMKVASIPRSNGGRSYEIDATVAIPRKVLQDFASSIGKGSNLNAVLKELGILTSKESLYKDVENGEQTWKKGDMIMVPFTRVENNNNTFAAGDLDSEIDAGKWGKPTAYKLTIDRDAKSMNRK